MIKLLIKDYDFIKDDKFGNEICKGGIFGKRKGKPVLLTRIWPPGLALAVPDMTEVRVLIQFRTLRVQKLYFDEIS